MNEQNKIGYSALAFLIWLFSVFLWPRDNPNPLIGIFYFLVLAVLFINMIVQYFIQMRRIKRKDKKYASSLIKLMNKNLREYVIDLSILLIIYFLFLIISVKSGYDLGNQLVTFILYVLVSVLVLFIYKKYQKPKISFRKTVK